MKLIKSILILITILTISSCTINNTDVEGKVDLVYSSTITIHANDFIAEDEFVSIAEYGWDNLYEEIVDYGMVLGYLRFEGTTAWQALPFSVPFENDLVNLRYLFDIDNFSLVIEGEVANNNEANANLFNRDVLRVIAIPPSEIAHGKGINYRDYEQVTNLYKIEWNN